MKLFAGNANHLLGQAIANRLGLSLGAMSIKRFPDMEIFLEVNESVRGEDVFFIQPTCYPANDTLMELFIGLDALRRASAKSITVVLPYFGYGRQDRKSVGRTSISAKLVANLLVTAGAQRVIMVDLHAEQLQGFFDIPTDHLSITPLFAQDLRQRYSSSEDLVVVSPDVGGVRRARALATLLQVDLAIIDKRREKPGYSQVMNIIGNVAQRPCILVDDIVDSGGTLCTAAEALYEHGAAQVEAYVVHPVLSGTALERIVGSKLNSITVTDTIPLSVSGKKNKVRQLSVAPLLAEAIRRLSQGTSIATLMELHPHFGYNFSCAK